MIGRPRRWLGTGALVMVRPLPRSAGTSATRWRRCARGSGAKLCPRRRPDVLAITDTLDANDKAERAWLKAQPKPPREQSLLLEEIVVGERLNPLQEHVVLSLTESIEEIGLQVPISVYERRFTPPPTELVPNPEPDSGWEYVLIAGHHRLEAFKRLGAEEEGRDDLRHWHRRFVFIPVCIFQNLDHARIWEVHENTARGSLSKEERDRQLRVLADRKRAAAEAAGVSMQCIETPDRPQGHQDWKAARPAEEGLDPTLILVANSVSDHVAGCRAAKREQRVLAVGVAMCQSAILIRLTAAAVMTCCKWVLARPI